MAKTMKGLLRISMVIRNLGTLNNCSITKRFVQTTSCNSKYNKESLVSARPHLVNQNDVNLVQPTSLESSLKNSQQIAKLLHIVEENALKMSPSEAVLALDTLFNVDRSKLDKTHKIYEEKEFLTLCEILRSNIQRLNIHELIVVLKALIHFDVPTTSIIVHVVLQMLRHSVNQLSLPQIAFIDNLLSKCEKVPLVEALMIALPIVFENNTLLKVDRENIQSITLAVKYLSRKSNTPDVFTVLIAALQNYKQPIDPQLAKSLFWSFCDLKCVPEGLPYAVNRVQKILAENITYLDREVIKTFLRLISEKIRCRERHFYHEGLVDACVSAVISEDWGFIEAVYVLRKLIAMNHTQLSLLDYIAAKCFEDPKILKTTLPSNITTVISGFSNADYKPVFWDVIQESVMSDRTLESQSHNYPLDKLAVSLATLDCYSPKLLEKVFALNRSSLSYSGQQRVLMLYQAVKALYPQYTGPWPNETVRYFILMANKHKTDDYPLLPSLECALGGRRYVLTNVRSKFGHIIDHVLVMRKGGFPIAINNNADTDTNTWPVQTMDKLQPPPDSQVILVLYIPKVAYSVNNQRMKGVWSLRIKSLEALTGYTAIPIQSMMWTALSSSEKIRYLMQAIRLKCDDVSISANS